MTVFKAFLKVLNRYKGTVILYTVILVFFAGFSLKNNENGTSFVASKPSILIVNHDQEEGITQNLVQYIEKNSEQVNIKDGEYAEDDAIFYRDANYIIYIPKNFRDDFLQGKNPSIDIKSTGDYQASLAEMLLNRYLRVANFYFKITNSEEETIQLTENTLAEQVEINVTSKLDVNRLEKVATYYNFTNYCILAGCIYIVCFILSSFKEYGVKKRTIISSTPYAKLNRNLLLSNSLFAIALWIFYVLISIFLIGDVMFSMHGLFYMSNSFLFTLCALTIAFLIGNLLQNKNAISGLVNVIALGSSFLCGSFVPMEWLPSSVLTIAHTLPSYWYIKTNECLKIVEVFDMETLKPILFNMGILLCFSIVFVLITNIISSRKRKIG